MTDTNKAKKTSNKVKIIIIVLMTILILILALFLPSFSRTAHAKSFANKQCEYMQTELKKGTPVETVKAITQSRITLEHNKNEEFDGTFYTIEIDDKNHTCQIDVKMLYDGHYNHFKSTKLNY